MLVLLLSSGASIKHKGSYTSRPNAPLSTCYGVHMLYDRDLIVNGVIWIIVIPQLYYYILDRNAKYTARMMWTAE